MTLNLKYFMYLSDYFPQRENNNILYNNTSFVKINGQQLFIAKYFDCKNCKPGNDEKCDPKPKNIGFNYPWNNWRNARGGYIFLLGDYKTKKFNILEREKIPGIDILGNDSEPRLFKNDILGNDNDYRLFKSDKGIIYSYGSSLYDIYEIVISDDNKKVRLEHTNEDYRTEPNKSCNLGKNLALVEYKIYENHVHLLILDWFYSDGVYAFERKSGENLSIHEWGNRIGYKKQLISYNINTGFDGKGSFYNGIPEDIKKYGRNYGKLPMFSFGSNFIKIDTKIKGYKNVRISVAHSKIHSSEDKYPYISGSNVDYFRKNIYNDMINIYGDKYIEHYGTGSVLHPDGCVGWIYLMYFILLLEKEDGSFDMKLGNSYLPLNFNEEHKDKYKFSLIFATGIQQENEDIIITAGEGDMYSILLKFSIDSIIEDCIHDVTNMDMDKYLFKVIGYKNGKSIVEDTLNKVVSGFDGLKGGRRYILVK